MKAYVAFAAALKDQGVHTMFGLIGDANMQYTAHYIDAMGGRYYGATHEAGAITMADGYHRMSGEVTVATVTHGPGLMNTLTALTEATKARSQMVLLTGDTPAVRTWTQSLDIGAAIAPTGAGYERVYRPETAPLDLARALHRARTERRPIVLNFPYDMMQQDVEPVAMKPTPVISYLPPRPDDDAIERALDVIAGAKRPLVLGGRGAALSGARDALLDLAGILGAPVATTLLGRDMFRGHPMNLGIAGSLSNTIATDAIVAADVIIAFGAGLNRYTTDKRQLFAGKRIVQIDIEPRDIGLYLRVDEALIGDARQVATALADALREAEFEGSGWGRPYAERIANWTPESEFTDLSHDGTVDVRTAVIQLDRVLPENRTVVTDVGRFIVAGWRYLSVPEPRRFTHMSTFGSIGLGLGAGIGAAAVDPSTLTVALMGDGGFMMTLGELTSAVRNKIPLLVVVLNDGAYGAETNKLRGHGESEVHSFIDWPELAPLAEAMGARAMTVRAVADFAGIPKFIEGLTGPALVDVRMDREANVGHW
ncbi:MAG: acetolactate synthase [Microbacteriaceae bacterium]|nr:acetolactate synthase [Microbacteriaceae bacterium]